MTDVVEFLVQLVRTPSVNPMGRAFRVGTDGEARMCALLEGHLKGLGLRVERREVAPGRENVLAWWEPPGGARRWILWDAHMDTVPEDGMTVAPFGGEVSGGRLYGRGACDVKASVAAMVVALERLQRERPRGAAGVVLALTADEEFTHKGSSALAEMELGVDLGFVAEPTGFDIVIGHKGAVRFEVVVAGESCHSSAPHRGRNAIYKMARVVEALEGLAHELARSPSNELLGRPTMSVGRIEGGQAVNVVPDWCRLEVDRRLIPGETPAHAMDQARAWIGERVGTMEDVTIRSMGIEMTALEPRVGAEDLGAMAEAIRSATGMTPKTVGVPYGTDAGPLSQRGLRCVVLGPGDIAQAHTRDEWVELEEVRQGVEVYVELARRLGERIGRP